MDNNFNEAIYPGSFDPITRGHLDIIRRSAKVFDRVHVVCMVNQSKKYAFSLEERMDMIRRTLDGLGDKVVVDSFCGLLVDYCERQKIYTVIRGLRALTDFDYEFQLALTNRRLNDKVDSVLFVTGNNFSYISSSMVKEIASYHGDVSFMVEPYVEKKLSALYNDGGNK